MSAEAVYLVSLGGKDTKANTPNMDNRSHLGSNYQNKYIYCIKNGTILYIYLLSVFCR